MGQCCQGSEKNKKALKPARRTAESTNVISFFDSRRETLFPNEQYNHKNSNPTYQCISELDSQKGSYGVFQF